MYAVTMQLLRHMTHNQITHMMKSRD